jgi:hypothetical protein
MKTQYSNPTPHPTRWTLAVWAKLPSGEPYTRVYDYLSQDEAELELANAQARGERGYVVPPVSAWGEKLA